MRRIRSRTDVEEAAQAPDGLLGGQSDPCVAGTDGGAASRLPALAQRARVAAARLRQAEKDRTLWLALLARAASAGRGDASRALKSSAESAQVSRQTLQEFVTLTTRWEPAELAGLLGRRDRAGRAITRALLLRLARGPSTARAAFDAAVASGDLDLALIFPDLQERRRCSGETAMDDDASAMDDPQLPG
jgi:hypothetical protein